MKTNTLGEGTGTFDVDDVQNLYEHEGAVGVGECILEARALAHQAISLLLQFPTDLADLGFADQLPEWLFESPIFLKGTNDEQ